MAKRKHELIEPISPDGEEIKEVTVSVTGNRIVAFEEAPVVDGGFMKNALHMIEFFTDLPDGSAGELDFEDIEAINKILEDILPNPAPAESAPVGAEVSSPTAQQS